MYTIFKRAKNVIAWLSDWTATVTTYRFFGYLTELSMKIGSSESKGATEMDSKYHHEGDSECRAVQRSMKPSLHDFVRDNTRFSRTWIRQEIHAARNVVFVGGAYRFTLASLQQTPFRPMIRTLDILVSSERRENYYHRSRHFQSPDKTPPVTARHRDDHEKVLKLYGLHNTKRLSWRARRKARWRGRCYIHTRRTPGHGFACPHPVITWAAS